MKDETRREATTHRVTSTPDRPAGHNPNANTNRRCGRESGCEP